MRNHKIATGQSLPSKSGFDLSVAKNTAQTPSGLSGRSFGEGGNQAKSR
jgi:hypothetical protein